MTRLDARRAPGICALLPIAALAAAPVGPVAAETADEFIARLNREFAELSIEGAAAGWTQATYINVDTELLNAKANERYLEYFSKAVSEAKKFEGQPMSAASRRTIDLLKLGVAAPAPDDPAKRAEFARLLSGMVAKYGSAKYCPQGPESCRDETQLKAVLESSRDYDELLEAWTGWHSTAKPLRADYVALRRACQRGRAAARLRGPWRDVAVRLRHAGRRLPARGDTPLERRFNRSTSSFIATRATGCQQKYGREKVPSDGPIPAHLLGNMWAQQWDAIYEVSNPSPVRAASTSTRRSRSRATTP